MEDLVKTARLYYDKSYSDIQDAAKEFFHALDSNKDGKVSLQEFLWFMRQQGHVKLRSSNFFKELDKEGKGLLGIDEVMAVYYIIKSGRPFCGGCGDFIPAMYFTCSKCFHNGNNFFCVCPKYFKKEAYDHEHFTFIDNYALLEAKRIQGIATCPNQHKVKEARHLDSIIHYSPSIPWLLFTWYY